MRMPKRGEKGFTLIELLIVVAILGVLAAVVIPNVGRFIGAGEEEAKATEFATIQSAVISMMVDNGLSILPNPVDTFPAQRDMSLFPDSTSQCTFDKINGPVQGGGTAPYTTNDGDGFLLYQHDIFADDNDTADLINYVVTGNTTYYYLVDEYGTLIGQYDTSTG